MASKSSNKPLYLYSQLTNFFHRERELTGLSLFSGIGGFEVACAALGGLNITDAVEKNSYRQQVLKKNFPHLEIHDDITKFNRGSTDKNFDFICGGFPCKGMSNAGLGQGYVNKESALWWEMLRVIKEFKPNYVVIENVRGFINRGLRECLASLRMAGYEVEVPQIVSAKQVGSFHQRERVFVLAYSHRIRQRRKEQGEEPPTCWSRQVGAQIAIARGDQDLPEYLFTDPLSLRQSTQSKPDCLQREKCLAEKTKRSDQEGSRSESRRLPVSCRETNSHRLQFPSSLQGEHDGLSNWLDRYHRAGWWLDNPFAADIAAPRRSIPHRQARISALGDSVVPQQASIPLMRLKYLHWLVDSVTLAN